MIFRCYTFGDSPRTLHAENDVESGIRGWKCFHGSRSSISGSEKWLGNFTEYL